MEFVSYFLQADEFLCDLQAGSKDALWEGVSERADEIRSSLLKDIASISHAVLTDFDWKVKVRNWHIFQFEMQWYMDRQSIFLLKRIICKYSLWKIPCLRNPQD